MKYFYSEVYADVAQVQRNQSRPQQVCDFNCFAAVQLQCTRFPKICCRRHTNHCTCTDSAPKHVFAPRGKKNKNKVRRLELRSHKYFHVLVILPRTCRMEKFTTSAEVKARWGDVVGDRPYVCFAGTCLICRFSKHCAGPA